MPQSRSEEWQSLFTYRNSLSQGDGEVHPITLKQATQRRYANKRKQIDVSDHDSNMSDWVDMSVGTPAPGVPVMASTAINDVVWMRRAWVGPRSSQRTSRNHYGDILEFDSVM